MQLLGCPTLCPADEGSACLAWLQECQNIKFVRESEVLSVSVEPGMVDGQVRLHNFPVLYCSHTSSSPHHADLSLPLLTTAINVAIAVNHVSCATRGAEPACIKSLACTFTSCCWFPAAVQCHPG